ncbi:MAG: Gfo/Idh/MocA family oxidoreductase [Phycisphaeraceae bacterium]
MPRRPRPRTPAAGISRRRFVQTTAVAAGALAFTYIPSSVFGANERVNLASIGVGGKGAGEVNDLSNAGCNIVALCDVDLDRAAGTIKKHPSAKVYRDFREMLDKEHKNFDAVSVSTPDHMHAPASVWAMELGKHVYCQKPLTHSIYEARVMRETARKYKVATQMGNQAHAGEPIRRGVELIQAGMLGAVREVHAWTNRPIWPQGMSERPAKMDVPSTLDWDLWLGPAPQRDYNKAYLPFNWRGWWDFGTGALGDMACHIMDMPYWALDLEYPDSVEAVSEGNTIESGPRWSTITYQFPARGKRASGVEQPAVKYVWYDGRKSGKDNAPIDLLEGEQVKKWDLIVIGDHGKMWFNRGNTNFKVTPADRLEEFQKSTPRTIMRVPNEDAEFVAACKGGPAALSNFDYAGAFSEMVLLGNVAIRAGEKIEWDGKNMKVKNSKNAQQYVQRDYRKGWTLHMPRA